MSDSPKPKHTSASALKSAAACSLAYYYERILKLPSKQWPKTIIGGLIHVIFEALRKPRHRASYDAITAPENAVDYQLSPSVARLVGWYQRKYQIEDKLLADLNDMLYVGLKLIDFHWTKADKDPATGLPITYGPEYEFLLDLGDGVFVKGFIDDMAQVEGVLVIRDFKSQGKRFTESELQSNIQGFLYQLFAWQRFNLPARVEFVLLRHASTAKSKDKERHLQVVPPISEHHRAGLIQYVKALAPRIREMTWEDALSDCCDDFGFCRNVCTHYAPHPYYLVCKVDDLEGKSPLSSHLSLDIAAQKAQDGGHIVIERYYKGCFSKWRE